MPSDSIAVDLIWYARPSARTMIVARPWVFVFFLLNLPLKPKSALPSVA